MGKSCIIIPTVQVGNETRESKLFKGLLSTLGNRETAKYVYSLIKVPEVQEKLKGIKKDENGEPTVAALVKALSLDKVLNKSLELVSQKEELGAVDSKGDPIIYDSYVGIIDKVNIFNRGNEDAVADISKTAKGYIISVEQKTIDNADVPNQLLFRTALNNQLLNFMRKLGFDVKVDGSLLYDGIFDPIHAETTADNLKTVIRIAKGEIGEQAFPEEFSHLIIAGLQNNALVVRILNQLSNEEALRSILGEQYSSYYNKYSGDLSLLSQEAAAKLLYKQIINPLQNNIHLLQRLWNFVKKMFNSKSVNDVNDIISSANQGFARIASQIKDESIMPILDRSSIMSSRPLYRLHSEVDKLQQLAEQALQTTSKRVAIKQRFSKSGRYERKDIKAIQNLQDLVEKKKYAKSCYTFLMDSMEQIELLQNELNHLLTIDSRSASDLDKIRRIASTLRNIKQFIDGYEPIVRQMMSLDQLRKTDSIDITEDDAVAIQDKATQLFSIINNINQNYKELRYDLVYNFLKIYWGEDKIINVGKHKGEALTLEMILDMANKDINFIDKMVSSMSDASDPLLSLIDKSVKVAKSKRDSILQNIIAELRAAHQKLINSGVTNTEFMYERDSNGKLTGRLISDYDFERFYKEREELKKHLESLGLKPYQIHSKIEAWEREHLQEVVVDTESGVTELVPIYKIDRLSRLNPAQREYYDTMIKAKSVLESFIPKRYGNLYNAVQVRNDLVSGIAEAKNVKDAAKQVLNSLKDNFIRRSDDTEFAQDLNVLLDFSGKPVNRIPVFYNTPLEDVNRLSLDFTSAIIAYAGMAVNYREMNRVVDVLELTRDLVKEREVKQTSGDKVISETFTILRKKFSKAYTEEGSQTNIGSRIDDYYDSVVYNKLKKDEGSWGIVDKAKLSDTIKSYTGVVGLGLNVFSGLSNVLQGKMQMFIEAIGKEYFNYKDLSKSKLQYYSMLPELLGELNSTKKMSKLGLLIEKFDALEEFYGNLGEQGRFKGPLARIFGSANLMFMLNMGEHYLHARTMLAILNHQKVLYNGNEISMVDAFEVDYIKDEHGNNISANLKIKDGVTNLDGSEITSDQLIDLKMKIGKVNQSLNGAFNEDDRGAIHRYAAGRLAMQFRQWMPAHYNRRFAGTYYDATMEQWREGYYRTFFRFSLNLMKDLKDSGFQIATHWNSLNQHEKANIRRALSEILIFYTLSLLISLGGPEKDKKGLWLDRMIAYNLKRLKLETGAAMPLSPEIIDNAWSILKSPAAAVKSVSNILDLIHFQNMFVEIQSGRYKGLSVWQRDIIEVLPVYPQIRKAVDIADEDYMFNIFR